MKNIRWLFLFLLCTATSLAQAAVFLTVSVDPTTLKGGINIKGCDSIVYAPMDSATLTLNDDYTFISEVTINNITQQASGYWTELDDNVNKFRLTYTGNPGDRTGAWGSFIIGLEDAANLVCPGGGIEAMGASLRVKKMDLTIKPLTGCGGTAKFQFQTETYGYDWTFGNYGKAKHKASWSGFFVVGPGYYGPMVCI